MATLAEITGGSQQNRTGKSLVEISQPEQPGFLKSMAMGTGIPRLAANVTKSWQATANLGRTVVGKPTKPLDLSAPVNMPWLGPVKPVGQEGSFTDRLKDSTGEGLKFASTVVPVGRGVRAVGSATLAGRVGQGFKSGIGAGAFGGGLYGAGEGIQQEGATLGSVAGSTAVGGLLGGATGGVLGSALPVVGAGVRRAVIPQATRDVSKRTSALTKLQQGYKPLDRKIVAADKSGIDTKRFLAESDLLVGAVDNNGKINSKIAVANMDDFLQPWEGRVKEALVQENKSIPLATLQQKMLATVDKSGLVGSMKQQARQRVLSEIEALAPDVDAMGNIPLSLVHDLKVQANRVNAKSFIDPEKNAIGKLFGRGLKEFVEENADSMNVKQYNEELRKLYSVRSVLEAMDGRVVEGGRLGKYFAQTIGAVAGNSVGGPVGAVVGAELGGATKGALMKRAFGGATGKALTQSARMTDALLPQSKSLGNRQMTQATTMAPTKNVIPTVKQGTQQASSKLSTPAQAQGGEMFAGAAVGFEKDENGNYTFNPEKALMGMVGMAGAQKLTSPAMRKKMFETIASKLTAPQLRIIRQIADNDVARFTGVPDPTMAQRSVLLDLKDMGFPVPALKKDIFSEKVDTSVRDFMREIAEVADKKGYYTPIPVKSGGAWKDMGTSATIAQRIENLQ